MQLDRLSLVGVGLLWCVVPMAGCMDEAVARAGPDQTVEAGATVTLDGSASKPSRRGALNYLWEVSEGPAITFSDANGQATTFEAPRQGTETLYRVRLKVTYVDYAGRPVPANSSTDDVNVRVLADPELLGQEPSDDETTDDGEAVNGNTSADEESVPDASTTGQQATSKQE